MSFVELVKLLTRHDKQLAINGIVDWVHLGDQIQFVKLLRVVVIEEPAHLLFLKLAQARALFEHTHEVMVFLIQLTE